MFEIFRNCFLLIFELGVCTQSQPIIQEDHFEGKLEVKYTISEPMDSSIRSEHVAVFVFFTRRQIDRYDMVDIAQDAIKEDRLDCLFLVEDTDELEEITMRYVPSRVDDVLIVPMECKF